MNKKTRMKLWTPCATLWALLHQSAQRFLYNVLEIPIHTRVRPGSCWLAYEILDERRVSMPPGMELQEISFGENPKKYLWFAVSNVEGPWRRGWCLDVFALAVNPTTRRHAWVHLDTRRDNVHATAPTALSLLECRVGNDFSFVGHPMPFPLGLRLPSVMSIVDRDGEKHEARILHPARALPLCVGNVHNSWWKECRAPLPSFSLYIASEVPFSTRRPEPSFFHEYAVFNPYVLYD